MKVSHLITELQKLDPDLVIYGFSDDPELLSKDESYKIFSVDDVNVHWVEKDRHEATDLPQVKFSRAEGSQKVAFLNLSYRF